MANFEERELLRFQRELLDLLIEAVLDLPEHAWHQEQWRNTFERSPHKQTDNITLLGPWPQTTRSILASTDSVAYPAEGYLEKRFGAWWPYYTVAEFLEMLTWDLFGGDHNKGVCRAMLVRLHPDGVVGEHTDRGPIFDKTFRLHLPLQTNPNATLTINGEERNLEVGKLYWIDNQVLHSAANGSTTIPRIHVIFDVLRP